MKKIIGFIKSIFNPRNINCVILIICIIAAIMPFGMGLLFGADYIFAGGVLCVSFLVFDIIVLFVFMC